MSVTAEKKLNSGFVMRPYSVFRCAGERKPSHIETMMKGVVYSFARGEKPCNFGYTQFSARLHVSKSSVARKVEFIKKDTSFHVERKGGKCSEYTYIGDPRAGAHVRTEDYFCTTKFNIHSIERYLTGAEIDVLSLIYTHTRNGSRFEASYKKIAGILNCAEKTISRAVAALFSADLIARPIRGVNSHRENAFCVNMKTLRKCDKAARKAERKAKKAEQESNVPFVPKDVRDANARAERQAYYDRLKAQAESVAQRNERTANADPQYRDVAKRLRELEFELAQAEIREPLLLPSLQAEKKRLQPLRTEILRRLGLSEADLQPRWRCVKCSDTGAAKNGEACDCYRSRGKP